MANRSGILRSHVPGGIYGKSGPWKTLGRYAFFHSICSSADFSCHCFYGGATEVSTDGQVSSVFFHRDLCAAPVRELLSGQAFTDGLELEKNQLRALFDCNSGQYRSGIH